MRLSVKGLAMATALMWAGLVLLVGLVHLAASGYGSAFLDVVASIYPGFDGAMGFGDVVVGTLYALVDGAVGGAILAWLYNLVVGSSRPA